MLNYTGAVGYALVGFDRSLRAQSSLLTGKGREKLRGSGQTEANRKKKRKASKAIAKQSRRANR